MSLAYYFIRFSSKRFPSLSHSGGRGRAGRCDKLLSKVMQRRFGGSAQGALCVPRAVGATRGRSQGEEKCLEWVKEEDCVPIQGIEEVTGGERKD